MLLVKHLNDSPVTVSQVQSTTRKDPTFSQFIQVVHQGWPETCKEETLKPYFH